MKTIAEQVQEAWQAAHPGFVFKNKPANWQTAVRELQDLFAGHFGADYAANRFRIPDDYNHFMQTIGGGGWYNPQGLGLSLYDAGTVARGTKSDFERMYIGDEYDPAEPLDEGLWLNIGCWSDRHDYLLACDPTQPTYGWVVDGHDSHPWLNGIDFAGCRIVAQSFTDFLRYLAK